jgi:hypothetical protein
MKFKQKSLIYVLLVSLVFITSCARPPIDEMNEAEEAVARAENDPDAVTYSGSLITRAQDALALMYEEADAKRYDSAINYANEAIELADRAINEGLTASLRARQEALAAVSAVRPQILETESRIETAKAADLPLDFNSIDSEFDATRRTYDQAQSAVSASRYQEAVFLSNNVRAGLNGINQKLGSSVMAVSRKK